MTTTTKVYRALCALVLNFCFTPLVFASGMALPRADAQALAMADANVALAHGAAAQIVNPANLALDATESWQWASGIIAADIRAKFHREVGLASAAAGTYAAKTGRPVIPFLAISRHGPSFAWGLGMDAAYGLGSDWPDHAFDQFVPGVGNVDLANESDLTVLRVGPSVAWRVAPNVSLGARGFAQYVDAREENDLARVEGDGATAGFQIGMQFTQPSVRAALSYTSRTDTKLRGEQQTVTSTSRKVHAHWLLPDRLQAGVALRLAPTLWWELDVDWFGWSYVSEFNIVRDDGVTVNAGQNERRYDDTLSVRTGLEWQASRSMAVRLGAAYEPGPIPDRVSSPSTSMYAKTRVGMGASLALSRTLDVDLAYQFVRGHRRQVHETVLDDLMGTDTSVFEGSYATRSHVIGITLRGSL